MIGVGQIVPRLPSNASLQFQVVHYVDGSGIGRPSSRIPVRCKAIPSRQEAFDLRLDCGTGGDAAGQIGDIASVVCRRFFDDDCVSLHVFHL